MKYEQWLEEYRPVQNHLTSAPFDGTMFETYGPELNHVLSQEKDRVWSLVDGDDNNMYIANGYHLVNRIGYFITEKPFTGDGFLDVPVFEEDELEEFD